MSSLHVLFICPILINAYYLSLNELSNVAAEEYCQLQCNSHLPTFLDFEDYLNAIQSIKDTPFSLQHLHTKDIWIGPSYHNTTNHIDFESTDHCVVLSPLSDYRLQSKHCNEKHLFLCNSCDLILHKYVIISTEMMNHSQSNTHCNTQFGTALASIHSVTDHNDAKLLCSLATNTENKSCWIGLNDIRNEGEYEWIDNTTFDFGHNISRGVYPWSNGVLKQPNAHTPYSDCVDLWRNNEYDIDSLDFNDDNCNIIQPFICNLPSALCHQEDWYSSTDDEWIFDDHSCDLYHYYDAMNDGGDTLRMNIIQHKWRYMIADYMFKLLDTPQPVMNGSGAITLRLLDISDGLTLNADYYVFTVGFRITTDGEIELFISYNGAVLRAIHMTDVYTIGNFYALRVSMTDEQSIKVYTNDKLYIEYDTGVLHIPTQYIISSIGIQNSKVSMHAKSLYISGSQPMLMHSTQIPETTQNIDNDDGDTDDIRLSATVKPMYTQTNQTVIPDPYNAYERATNTSSLITFSVQDLVLLLVAVAVGMLLLSCALCYGIPHIKRFCVGYSMKERLRHMSVHGAMHMPQHSSVDITLETEDVLQQQDTKELELDLSDIKENNSGCHNDDDESGNPYLKVQNDDESDHEYSACGRGMSSFDEYVTKGSQIINILNIPLPKTPDHMRSESVNSPSSEGYMGRRRHGYDILRVDPDINDEVHLTVSDVSDVFGSAFKKEEDSAVFEDRDHHVASIPGSEFGRMRR